jgi:alkylation response protein AidB-like acyl-CoA dehydrogenase
MILLRDSEDEAALRSTFRRIFAKYQGIESDPEKADASKAALWQQLNDIDALSMAAPEHSGGGEATMSQLCVVVEEAAANLGSTGLVEHLVATRFLGQESAQVPPANAGVHAATVALRPSHFGRWPMVATTASPSLVVGVHRDQLGALPLSAAQEGRGHRSGPLRFLDITIDDGQFVGLGPVAQHESVLDAWRVLTAAYLVGACDFVLARTVTYVKSRHQFGRPIGSYQSIQHGLADLPGMISGARLLVGKAAWAIDQPGDAGTSSVARNDITQHRVLASMAMLFAAETATAVVDRAIHFHGAIGAAIETGIGSYYRLVRSLPLLLGPMSIQRRRLADLLLEPTWTSH